MAEDRRFQIPHEGKIISINPITVGPGTYEDVGREIDANRLSRPTFGESVSTICHILNPPKEQRELYEDLERAVKIKMDNGDWFWGFTQLLYSKNGGMFAVDDIETNKGLELATEALTARLGKREEDGVIFSDDNSIRFTPDRLKEGKYGPIKLAGLKGIIALAGSRQSAGVIGKLALFYKSLRCIDPFLLAPQKVQKDTLIKPMFSSNYGTTLVVSADDWGDVSNYGGACAFGITRLPKEPDN